MECSRSEIENLIWNGNAEGHSVVTIFEQSTYGRKTVAADVDADGAHDIFGPFEIPYEGKCKYATWRDRVDAAANEAGKAAKKQCKARYLFKEYIHFLTIFSLALFFV